MVVLVGEVMVVVVVVVLVGEVMVVVVVAAAVGVAVSTTAVEGAVTAIWSVKSNIIFCNRVGKICLILI